MTGLVSLSYVSFCEVFQFSSVLLQYAAIETLLSAEFCYFSLFFERGLSLKEKNWLPEKETTLWTSSFWEANKKA